MSTPDTPQNPEQTSPPTFDPDAPHQLKPKLRPVRAFPLQAQNQGGQQQTLLGLADAQQIATKIVATAPAAHVILPMMDGSRTLEQIVGEVGRGLTAEFLQQFVAQLDDAGLLAGPVFDSMWERVKKDFDSTDVLPPASTAAFVDALLTQSLGKDATEQQKQDAAPGKIKEIFDQWIDKSLEKATAPSFDHLPKAIVVPHIDYGRGWINYAQCWGRLRVVDRPDRVVILGTNHYGRAQGVCACDKGYETALGVCPLDTAMAQTMREKLGDAIFEHRYDHEREHSIELQTLWIQHCIGADDKGKFCPVFGVLVHDPAVNNGEAYEGNGIGLDAFVAAMREAISELPGKTLIVSSADLSHVGPAFGDPKPLAGDDPEVAALRNNVFRHDNEMLGHMVKGAPEDLVGAMAWQQNPTRWCSVGNMVAAYKIVQPESVELLNYAASLDPQGMGMVTSCAMVMR